jgi:hypothetical protein
LQADRIQQGKANDNSGGKYYLAKISKYLQYLHSVAQACITSDSFVETGHLPVD